MPDVSDQLAAYIDALRPIIYINHFDFEKIDRIIERAVGPVKIYEFNNAFGQVDFRTKAPVCPRPISLRDMLSLFIDGPQNCVLILRDVHCFLEKPEPEIVACLNTIARHTISPYEDDYHVTLIIVATRQIIPDELMRLVTVLDIPSPHDAEIGAILDEYAKEQVFSLDPFVKDNLVQSFQGLSEFEIRQILHLAYQRSGGFSQQDTELVLQEKEQAIKKSSMLEIIKVDENMDGVGGLDELRKYLERKAEIFKRQGAAKRYGVDLPKGVLIVGMPGCGKTLTAKVSAKLFGVPLLRLDVGRLMGKYVGQSENNLHKAILIAEAFAPCVLWIDELEKAFAGIGGMGGGGEVTTRLFGHFLTWLQEKESPVYVVATSNDISRLPAEFLRKGRFDEIFTVELPNPQEIMSILEIHLKKRKKLSRKIDIPSLSERMRGYSGADIEAIVKESIERAFLLNKAEPTTDDLREVMKSTKPMSETFKEQIAEIRKCMERYDARPASRKP